VALGVWLVARGAIVGMSVGVGVAVSICLWGRIATLSLYGSTVWLHLLLLLLWLVLALALLRVFGEWR